MKIYLAADHAGFELKEKIKKFLSDAGYEIDDKGAFKIDPEDDYPDFISRAAEAVSFDPENNRAVILGGSGQGEAIVANRFKGVRAVVYYGGSDQIITLSREHNNANVLSLGARFIDEDTAKHVLTLWLQTSFAGGRHQRRIDKIDP